jgi:diguanylate cyclase (GGDEF)-like protein/PAS domain S-box-containing protein
MYTTKERFIYFFIICLTVVIVPIIAYLNVVRYINDLQVYHFIMPTTIGLIMGFGFANSYLLKLTNKKLRESELEYKQLVDNISGRFALYQHSGCNSVLSYVSKGSTTLLGVNPDRIIGKPWIDIVNWLPETLNNVQEHIETMRLNPNTTFENEVQFIDHNNVLRTWNLLESAKVDATGKLISINGLVEDITDKRVNELQMKLLANVFSHIKQAMIITTTKGVIININEAFTKLTGYAQDEIIGKNSNILQSGRHDKEFYQCMWDKISQTHEWRGEVWNKKKNGDLYFQALSISAMVDSDGQVTHYIGLLSDVTEKKRYVDQLKKNAYFDKLTTLSNRVLLEERIDMMISKCQLQSTLNALAFVDLDGFKLVNDTYGHDAGDFVLQQISKRMQQLVKKRDTISRLGGDEFVLLLTDISSYEKSKEIVERLIVSISKPISYKDHLLQVTVSVGISFYPDKEPIDRDEFIRRADKAMYKAKINGKNRYEVFS